MAMNLNKKINNFFLEFSLFSIYGLISNLVSFCLYFYFVKFLNINYMISYCVITSTIITINFFVYLKIFKTLYNPKRLTNYLITQIIFFFSHLLLIIILVEYYSLSKIYSHILSNIFLAVTIFFVYKFFVFKKKSK